MTIISGVTVDWVSNPRIIHIPHPTHSVTIEDLQDTLQSLEDDEEGIVYPYLRDTSGGEILGGTTLVGWTMKLRNAQVQFEGRTTPEESGTCTSDDTTGKILNATGGAFVTNGVSRGHIVFNSTTGAMATVLTVESNTQLKSQLLSGGSRATWLSTDSYTIYENEQCTISGGNLVAVDENGDAMSPILASANTDTTVALSSSATQVISGSGVTEQDKTDIADAVRTELTPELDMTTYADKVLTNKREVAKSGDVWQLIVYDDDGLTPILTKDLKDYLGSDITDLPSGVMAIEEANAS